MATDVTAEGEEEKIAKDTNRKDINRLFNDISMNTQTHTRKIACSWERVCCWLIKVLCNK